MKLQASLEFLLILAIIGGLSLAMLTSYKSTLSKNQDLLSAISPNNSLQNLTLNSQSPQNFGVAFYLPANSTLDKSNPIQIATFGCNSGTLSVFFNSSSITFAENKIDVQVSGIGLNAAYFTPEVQGYHQIDVNYNYSCGDLHKNAELNLTTYSFPSIVSFVNNSPSAAITDRKEQISYNRINDGPLVGVTEFDHCTYAGIFGPTGISSQCDTSNAWEYSVFSSYCYSTSNYQTRTYCIVPYPTGYLMGHPDPLNYSYNYSFLLDIYSQNLDFKANLSNNHGSKLFLNGHNVGNVTISRVSGTTNIQEINFLIFNGNSKVSNPSAYSQYFQAKNNLYGNLDFYNGTTVSTDIQSSLDSSVLAYSKSLNNLINSTIQNSPCAIQASSYVCNSLSLFSYEIDINAIGTPLLNSTISSEGSVIKIIRK